MKLIHPLSALMLALAGASLATPAHAVTTVTNVTTDTITTLDIDWTFYAADSGGMGSYASANWQAWLTPTWTGSQWQVDAWYQHMVGPHGESAEGAPHWIGSVTFTPGSGSFTLMPVQDHLLPTPHAAAHTGFFNANGPAWTAGGVPPGFARVFVTHVPEPGQWALLLAGLAGLAGWRRRAR
jgi:hypothetical protein